MGSKNDGIADRILEYSWKKGIEILEENNGEMELDVFYDQLCDAVAKEFGIPQNKPQNRTVARRIAHPAYWDLPVEKIYIRPLNGGKGVYALRLLEKGDPNFKKDYRDYIASNLAKRNGNK